MKHVGKCIGALFLAVAMLFGCMPAVWAASVQQPQIVLKASGVQGQYTLRLENFSSKFESAQFDICVSRAVDAPEVAWRDDSPAHFQRIDARQQDGKTVLTVYIDRLSPIANSNNADLAELTFRQPVPASSFSAGAELLALDENQEETVFQSPALVVSGSGAEEGSSGSGSSSDSDSDSDSGAGAAETFHRKEVLRWEDVSEYASENGGQKILKIPMRSGQVIGRDIFLQAAEKGFLLRLDYGDYIWTFSVTKELSIPDNRVFYDFSLEKLRYKSLSAAVDSTDLAQFEIAYSGPLPCEATLSYRLGDSYAGETVHLSYYNENKATLSFQESAAVSSGGWVDYRFTHASKYVISSADLWGSSAPPAASGATVSSNLAANIVVPPEDQVEDPAEEPDEDLEKEAEPEEEASSSIPEEPEEKEESERPRANRTDWALPAAILLLTGGIVTAVILIQMLANKKKRPRI